MISDSNAFASHGVSSLQSRASPCGTQQKQEEEWLYVVVKFMEKSIKHDGTSLLSPETLKGVDDGHRVLASFEWSFMSWLSYALKSIVLRATMQKLVPKLIYIAAIRCRRFNAKLSASNSTQKMMNSFLSTKRK